jgi:hypothetical protein
LALVLDGSQPLWLAFGFCQNQKQLKAQTKGTLNEKRGEKHKIWFLPQNLASLRESRPQDLAKSSLGRPGWSLAGLLLPSILPCTFIREERDKCHTCFSKEN